jgi:hypothetical protein
MAVLLVVSYSMSGIETKVVKEGVVFITIWYTPEHLVISLWTPSSILVT